MSGCLVRHASCLCLLQQRRRDDACAMPLSPSAAPPARWLRGLAKPEVLRDEGVAAEANACVAWGALAGEWKIISVFCVNKRREAPLKLIFFFNF